MKFKKQYILLITTMLFIGCDNTPAIVQKEYVYEKMFFENHRFTFDIHLENVGSSGKIHDLINNLIYENKSFDEYIEYKERNFTGNIDESDYPLMDDDGTENIYHSDLIEKYSIVFNNDMYIIFEYNTYYYISGTAHGNSFINYYVLDIKEKRILDINDLIYPIPDDLLKEIIESNYNENNFFRDNIWPPDAVNFCNKNVELIWNTYTLAPYALGIINIEIQDEIVGQYLTEKGKILRKLISKAD